MCHLCLFEVCFGVVMHVYVRRRYRSQMLVVFEIHFTYSLMFWKPQIWYVPLMLIYLVS